MIDDPTDTARAYAGGKVVVYSGLFSLVSDEDELAGVLGHEIAHVLARHTVRHTLAPPPCFSLPSSLLPLLPLHLPPDSGSGRAPTLIVFLQVCMRPNHWRMSGYTVYICTYSVYIYT